MEDTKRVDELEVGDIVIFPGCKGSLTISKVEKLNEWEYRIFCVNVGLQSRYASCVEVAYLGNNKKEEEAMTTQKVDCSALYPYFDALVEEEVSFNHSKTIPVYVRQQLKNIHELFEGVLGFTLEEVKTLYFERKMSRQESKVEEATESKPKTKKAKDLQPGDKVIGAISRNILTVSSVEKVNHLIIRYKESPGYNYTTHLDNEYELVD